MFGRMPAIQRFTFTPDSIMKELVYDMTFQFVTMPEQTASGSTKHNCCGLMFSLNNPGKGPGAIFLKGTSPDQYYDPYWGNYKADRTRAQQAFGPAADTGDIDHSQAPPGWSRWVGASDTTPYRQATVVGALWEVRAEQLHKVFGNTTAQKARAICMMTRIDKTTSENTGNTQLVHEWQDSRNTYQTNMTPPISTATGGPANSTQQQAYQKGSWSAKKFFGIGDIKDNQDTLGARYYSTNTLADPTHNAFLNIGFFDRIPNSSSSTANYLPDFLVRVKIKMMCLLTEPHSGFNEEI